MIICDRCHKERKPIWIETSPTTQRLLLKCDCDCIVYLKKKRSSVFPNPVAFFKDDKTGQKIPVDKKGNVIDHDPYYKENDPRGWKHAGHKDTRGYHRKIHLDERGNELK